jgi:hypothetical protein
MTTSLFLAPADFEPVYGWFESHAGSRVQVWGLDDNRRAALVAYSDGPGDDFGWGNWVCNAYEDPSQIAPLFGRLELVVEADLAASLEAAFPGRFTTAA